MAEQVDFGGLATKEDAMAAFDLVPRPTTLRQEMINVLKGVARGLDKDTASRVEAAKLVLEYTGGPDATPAQEDE